MTIFAMKFKLHYFSNLFLEVIGQFLWKTFDAPKHLPIACLSLQCPKAKTVQTCKSDGSCHYKGKNFTNYDSIPEELSGCEQRCHCEDEEVLCQNACYESQCSLQGLRIIISIFLLSSKLSLTRRTELRLSALNNDSNPICL